MGSDRLGSETHWMKKEEVGRVEGGYDGQWVCRSTHACAVLEDERLWSGGDCCVAAGAGCMFMGRGFYCHMFSGRCQLFLHLN